MHEADLVLLHAPSVYDFRKRTALYGPVSDVVPATQIFEMYPIGFMTMLEYLERNGYSVRIINIALKMLSSRWFNAEKLLRKLKPAAFGLDLHWLVHAQGSLELGRIVKQLHPGIPVIFGGLSASYYHEELIRYPQVDYVLRGDSTEEPLRQLLAVIKEGGSPAGVPNLTWKEGGEVRINKLSHVPSHLGKISFDYRKMMASCGRHRDIRGHLPFKAWFRYPIVAILSSRGCSYDCAICGGSASAYRRICGRTAPALPDPGRIAGDIGMVSRHIRAPIMIMGDIRHIGSDYASNLLSAIKKENVRNQVAFAFYTPPPADLLEMIAGAVPNFNIQVSPESHDQEVRSAFGRTYSNGELEDSIARALELGCKRADIFFMIGIPGQTPGSVRDTVHYCSEFLDRFRRAGHGGKVHPYISPLAPFLDPGSRVFEDPGRHGYRLFSNTLEDHRRALLEPSWKYTLNYETRWMNRDELVAITYEAARGLNKLKLEHGLVSHREAKRVASRIAREQGLIEKIDSLYTAADGKLSESSLQRLMSGFPTVGPSTICKKREMDWPTGLIRFSPARVIFRALARS